MQQSSLRVYPPKPFNFDFPINYQDPNNGKTSFMGNLSVQAIGYRYTDGSFRSTDIELLTWEGNDVTSFVSAARSEQWDDLTAAADNHFRNQYVTSKESTPNC